MSEKLLVPDIGDFENVEVIEILVKPGSYIKENDPIVWRAKRRQYSFFYKI